MIHGLTARAIMRGKRRLPVAFPAPGSSGDADDQRFACVRKDVLSSSVASARASFHCADRATDRALVAVKDSFLIVVHQKKTRDLGPQRTQNNRDFARRIDFRSFIVLFIPS